MHEPPENKQYLTIKEAAKYLRVSKDTLRRWEKRKILKPFRSPTGWRYYSRRQLDYVFIQKPDFSQPPKSIIKPQPVETKTTPSSSELLPISSIQTISTHQPLSKFKKTAILFLAFFLSLNVVLISFFVLQNLIVK